MYQTDYNTKVREIEKKNTDHVHDKYITASEFNKLTAENFAVRLTHENLASKNDITNFVNRTDFDDKLKNLKKKVTSNKTKHLLVKNELENYKYLIQIFLLVKGILIMMKHNFTQCFNQFTKLFHHFLVFQTQSQNENLRDCEMKNSPSLV